MQEIDIQEHVDAYNEAIHGQEEQVIELVSLLEKVFDKKSAATCLSAMAIAFANIADDPTNFAGGLLIFANVAKRNFDTIYNQRTTN